jgi:hypothetical protein
VRDLPGGLGRVFGSRTTYEPLATGNARSADWGSASDSATVRRWDAGRRWRPCSLRLLGAALARQRPTTVRPMRVRMHGPPSMGTSMQDSMQARTRPYVRRRRTARAARFVAPPSRGPRTVRPVRVQHCQLAALGEAGRPSSAPRRPNASPRGISALTGVSRGLPSVCASIPPFCPAMGQTSQATRGWMLPARPGTRRSTPAPVTQRQTGAATSRRTPLLTPAP